MYINDDLVFAHVLYTLLMSENDVTLSDHWCAIYYFILSPFKGYTIRFRTTILDFIKKI